MEKFAHACDLFVGRPLGLAVSKGAQLDQADAAFLFVVIFAVSHLVREQSVMQ